MRDHAGVRRFTGRGCRRPIAVLGAAALLCLASADEPRAEDGHLVDEQIDAALGALNDPRPPRLFLTLPEQQREPEFGQPFRQEPFFSQEDFRLPEQGGRR